MNSRPRFAYLLLFVSFFAFGFLKYSAASTHRVNILYNNTIISPKSTPLVQTLAKYVVPPKSIILEKSAHLIIPKINVNAPIEQVGLTADNSLEVPKVQTNVGWFLGSPIPGLEGSSIIDGHFSLVDGSNAVFANLFRLNIGDTFSVENTPNPSVYFIVQKIKIFPYKNSAEEVFNSPDNLVRLNLITCEGVWNAAQKSYSGRLVVFGIKQ